MSSFVPFCARQWPRLAIVVFAALTAAGCSDSARFSNGLFAASRSNNTQPPTTQADVTGSVHSRPAASRVETRALPAPSQPATVPSNASGGQGLGAYRPAQVSSVQNSYPHSSDVTGSVNSPAAAPALAPQPGWSWEGGTAITVGAGEDIETIARKYGVPQVAILQANKITDTAAVRPGRKLVIPRYVGTGAAASQPVAAPRPAPVASSGFSHTVEPGQSLLGIAKRYNKPVAEIARANNLQPYAKLNAGDRIVIPGVQKQASVQPVAAPQVAQPQISQPQVSQPRTVAPLASAEPAPSARVVTPTAQPETESSDAVKAADAVGAIPSFRWPARGRVIASYGSKQSGQTNDGINIAVPEGTPVKAAEDGTIAYAGNELKGYGNLVLIRHSNGFVSAYAHASELMVKRGDTVKRGQIIARSGQTGNVTSPQLHFEIRKGSTPVDPSQYLGGNG
jgi:murein DD-endopeptidase MepM/ murein hydrolase activator NlpD